MGTELLFRMRKKFWKWMVGNGCTLSLHSMQLNCVPKTVKFLCSCNLKKFLKSSYDHSKRNSFM
jgi:hypothetical protein